MGNQPRRRAREAHAPAANWSNGQIRGQESAPVGEWRIQSRRHDPPQMPWVQNSMNLWTKDHAHLYSSYDWLTTQAFCYLSKKQDTVRGRKDGSKAAQQIIPIGWGEWKSFKDNISHGMKNSQINWGSKRRGTGNGRRESIIKKEYKQVASICKEGKGEVKAQNKLRLARHFAWSKRNNKEMEGPGHGKDGDMLVGGRRMAELF